MAVVLLDLANPVRKKWLGFAPILVRPSSTVTLQPLSVRLFPSSLILFDPAELAQKKLRTTSPRLNNVRSLSWEKSEMTEIRMLMMKATRSWILLRRKDYLERTLMSTDTSETPSLKRKGTYEKLMSDNEGWPLQTLWLGLISRTASNPCRVQLCKLLVSLASPLDRSLSLRAQLLQEWPSQEGFQLLCWPLPHIFRFFPNLFRIKSWLELGSCVEPSALSRRLLIPLSTLFKHVAFSIPSLVAFGRILSKTVSSISRSYMHASLNLVTTFKMIPKTFLRVEIIFLFEKIKQVLRKLFKQVQNGLDSLPHGKLVYSPFTHTGWLNSLPIHPRSMGFFGPLLTIRRLGLYLMLRCGRIIREALFGWTTMLALTYTCLVHLVRHISFP